MTRGTVPRSRRRTRRPAVEPWVPVAERWLRRSGVPAFVVGRARPASVARRWPVVVGVAAAVAGAVLLASIVAGYGAAFGSVWLQLALAVCALFAGVAATVVGLPEIALFTLRWFVRTAWRSGGGMLRILPILLVALVFTFLSTETWQSIGRLTGTPLVLAALLLVVLALLPLLRSGVDLGGDDVTGTAAPGAGDPGAGDPGDGAPGDGARAAGDPGDGAGAPGDGARAAVRGHRPDIAAARAALPAGLAAALDRAPSDDGRPVAPLGLTERINLRLIGALGRALVAAVVGLAVTAFFCVFGVLTVDAAVTALWTGAAPDVWWQFTVGAHQYTLTAEHVRVAAFLGVFSALYFVVSASTDRHLAEALSADTRAHVRECLAVRTIYRSGGVAPVGDRRR